MPFFADRAPELASRLISDFGSLSAAMDANTDHMSDVEVSDACRILRAARNLSKRALVEDFSGLAVVSDDPRLIDYLRCQLDGTSEVLCAIFMDSHGRYIRDELLADGSVGQVRVAPRTLFSRAFQLRASRVIVAHNHPSGNCRPSVQDRAATQSLSGMGRALGVELVDHLIVSRRGYFSFEREGLL
ncbi:MAG: JAB domain-containing protein [Croceibacterium sp.]